MRVSSLVIKSSYLKRRIKNEFTVSLVKNSVVTASGAMKEVMNPHTTSYDKQCSDNRINAILNSNFRINFVCFTV